MLNSSFIQGFELDDYHPLAPLHSNSLLLQAMLAAAPCVGRVSGERFLQRLPRERCMDWTPPRNGLTAAALAASGYVGIKRVFARPYGGWLAVFGEGHRTYPEEIYAGLGALWETERIAGEPAGKISVM